MFVLKRLTGLGLSAFRLVVLCVIVATTFLVPGVPFFADGSAEARCVMRKEPLPRSCAALNARGLREIWKGDFSGVCTAGDKSRRIFGHGCFRNKRSCDDWIYNMQSKADGKIRQSQCRRLK